jgi:hypothetical protein
MPAFAAVSPHTRVVLAALIVTLAAANALASRDQSPPPALAASAAVEQTVQGSRPALAVMDSFDGLGHGFSVPQGPGGAPPRNPSDNSLAVGPDHIVQIVNSQLAVFTKRGRRYEKSGVPLYGPIPTNTLFTNFGDVCGSRANGDAVVRYDQLAGRWLVVMPIFRRAVARGGEATPGTPARPGEAARPGQASDPGPAVPPGPAPPQPAAGPGQGAGSASTASYAICYALSTTNDPLGPYVRYVFERPLFPDYPRPAVWPDGYYVPTSTGDDVIQKHTCIVDRGRMLKGLPATEQCLVIDGVNFLNNADLDGVTLPPPGAPNIMMATGGTQLAYDLDDDGIYVWRVHVSWERPIDTYVSGPKKIAVTPYRYLCGGQLTNCVPQPGTDRRLDAQGDKIMARLLYRNLGTHESLVAVHSVDTAAGGGGVRWYEFRLDGRRDVRLHQQSTYAPDGLFRWMASPAIDRRGNIAIGYSFGGPTQFPGQRIAARAASDPPGLLTFHETVLAAGEDVQTTTLRWQDYTQTAIDPDDDCTIWYVGDYVKKRAPTYSTRIASVRLPDCSP